MLISSRDLRKRDLDFVFLLSGCCCCCCCGVDNKGLLFYDNGLLFYCSIVFCLFFYCFMTMENCSIVLWQWIIVLLFDNKGLLFYDNGLLFYCSLLLLFYCFLSIVLWQWTIVLLFENKGVLFYCFCVWIINELN
jgi:hypothetical protein